MVHCEPVGSGTQAFQYLAPYIFRVAISNNRLRNLENGNVSFAYKESATDQLRHCTHRRMPNLRITKKRARVSNAQTFHIIRDGLFYKIEN